MQLPIRTFSGGPLVKYDYCRPTIKGLGDRSRSPDRTADCRDSRWASGHKRCMPTAKRLQPGHNLHALMQHLSDAQLETRMEGCGLLGPPSING
ncbi:Hypothetical protein NTJ_06894 [Nesidiocoris tenuis]|uniref:Uncharacterized protein n=1 Tax=Nesidiocoris tenuis TaxID=355587 RepID=A0ABN7APD9_9HEMI|nr:Hypothetical protein NTJ_06894 [Nesidiocoris tenuis]